MEESAVVPYLISDEATNTVWIVIEDIFVNEDDDQRDNTELRDHDYQRQNVVVDKNTRAVNAENNKKVVQKTSSGCKIHAFNTESNKNDVQKTSSGCKTRAINAESNKNVQKTSSGCKTKLINNADLRLSCRKVNEVKPNTTKKKKIVDTDCQSSQVLTQIQSKDGVYTVSTGKDSEPIKVTHIAYKCQICGDIFLGEEKFKNHYIGCRQKNDIGIENLNLSSNVSTAKKDLRAKKILAYNCQICGGVYVGKIAFNRHCLRCEDDNFKTDTCAVCETVFEIKGKVRRLRRRLGHDSRCPKCEIKHRKMKIAEAAFRRRSMKPCLCELCGKNFTTPARLKTHKLIHTGEKPHKCEDCGLAYNRRDYLMKHISSHNRGVEPRSPNCEDRTTTNSVILKREFTCKRCEVVFDDKSDLVLHRRQHRTFKCDRCPKAFYQKPHLNAHYRTHAKRKHRCELCDAAFVIRANLKTHMLRHTGERPFQCDVCGATYQTRVQLNGHFRKHTGEKPYKCKQCVSEFRELSSLVKHRLIHGPGSENRPFKCEVCGGGFLRKRNLKIHSRVHEAAQETVHK